MSSTVQEGVRCGFEHCNEANYPTGRDERQERERMDAHLLEEGGWQDGRREDIFEEHRFPALSNECVRFSLLKQRTQVVQRFQQA